MPPKRKKHGTLASSARKKCKSTATAKRKKRNDEVEEEEYVPPLKGRVLRSRRTSPRSKAKSAVESKSSKTPKKKTRKKSSKALPSSEPSKKNTKSKKDSNIVDEELPIDNVDLSNLYCVIQGHRGNLMDDIYEPYIKNFHNLFTEAVVHQYHASSKHKEMKAVVEFLMSQMKLEKKVVNGQRLDIYRNVYKLNPVGRQEKYHLSVISDEELKDKISQRMRNILRKSKIKSSGITTKAVSDIPKNATREWITTEMKRFDTEDTMKFMLNSNLLDPSWNYFYKKECERGRNLLHWANYSMLHSTCEGFDFSLYNASHRVGHDINIHRGTKIHLKLPRNVPVMIIFHGRLVHSGCPSRFTEGCFTTGNDVRFFQYLSVTRKESTKKGSKRNTRTEDQKLDATLNEHKIDTNSFKMCESDCKLCNSSDNPFTSGSGVQIDVSKITDNLLKRNQLKVGKLLLGNLERHGWALFVGVQLQHRTYYRGIRNEIHNLLLCPEK